MFHERHLAEVAGLCLAQQQFTFKDTAYGALINLVISVRKSLIAVAIIAALEIMHF